MELVMDERSRGLEQGNDQGDVKQVLMSVNLSRQRGTLELVEMRDGSFVVCRDGEPVDAMRTDQRQVEKGVVQFLRTRRLVEAEAEVDAGALA